VDPLYVVKRKNRLATFLFIVGVSQLSFFLLGVNGVQPHTIRFVDGLGEKDELMLASRNLEDDSVGYMVEYLRGEESTGF